MKTLRHEEFESGCAAYCNGPYDGKWSKTLMGYGPEDSQFAIELTYNYGVKSYESGNDYQSITCRSKAAYQSAIKHSTAKLTSGPGSAPAVTVAAPGGYRFVVVDEDVPQGATVLTELCLAVSDLSKSIGYWSGFLGFSVVQQTGQDALLSCGSGQAMLRLVQLPGKQAVQHGTGFGRVAFSVPGGQLKQLETDILAAGYTVQTPYVSLDTPGKATVQVIILQDPDGYEVCFVGDEGFKSLSLVDPAAQQLVDKAIAQDKSVDWFEQQAKREAAMQAKGV